MNSIQWQLLEKKRPDVVTVLVLGCLQDTRCLCFVLYVPYHVDSITASFAVCVEIYRGSCCDTGRIPAGGERMKHLKIVTDESRAKKAHENSYLACYTTCD